MKITAQSNKKTIPSKISIQFDSDFEKNQFVNFFNSLVFDGLIYSQAIDKESITGIESDMQLDAKLFNFIGAIEQNEPFAIWYDIKAINTDPQRFQNRVDAYFELSADQVEKNFDSNKFDPIVVWNDPKKEKIFVLSGHSRLEGMKRRKEKYIPIRFFKGSEAEAIVFARIDANRIANKENLVSDLKAYKLARDGDLQRNITPYTKKDLQQAFKGKQDKLEYLSYLNPNGVYIEKLSDEQTISQYPRIQSYAAWVGNLRKNNKNMTNTHENDTFLYFYTNPDNFKINKEDFEKLVLERLAMGKDRIFPECNDNTCTEIKDFKEVSQNRELYKKLEQTRQDLENFKKRFSTNISYLKIYTVQERKILTQKALEKEKELKNLQRDIKKVEDAPGLFGFPPAPDFDIEECNYLIYYTLPKDKTKYKFFTLQKTIKEAKNELKEYLQDKEQKQYSVIKTIKL